MTLADEDTKSKLTDNAKRAIQDNALQCNASDVDLCKWRHLVAKFATHASGPIWWPNLLLMQVAPSGGQICNYCKWRHLMAIFATHASGANRWPNLLLMQVAPSGGQIC